MSTQSGYAPGRHLWANRRAKSTNSSSAASSAAAGSAPQVVYSKVASKPTLHHVESWSPETMHSLTRGSTIRRGVARKGSTCSDYTTYGFRQETSPTIYSPVSAHSVDYSSLASSVSGDYVAHVGGDYVTRSKLAQTCGCSADTSCGVCAPEVPTVKATAPCDRENTGHRPKYKSVRDKFRKEVNNNPTWPVSPLKHSKSMDHIAVVDSDCPRVYNSRDNYLCVGGDYGPTDRYRSRLQLNGTQPACTTHAAGDTRSTTPNSHLSRSHISKSHSFNHRLPHSSTSKRKDWNKLRHLIHTVGAMKAFRGSDRRSRVGKEVVRCLVDTQAIALPPLVLSRTRCTCCDNTTIRCPGSFDRKVQSARSYESLLVAAGRIPSVDLGDGHIQVSVYTVCSVDNS